MNLKASSVKKKLSQLNFESISCLLSFNSVKQLKPLQVRVPVIASLVFGDCLWVLWWDFSTNFRGDIERGMLLLRICFFILFILKI